MKWPTQIFWLIILAPALHAADPASIKESDAFRQSLEGKQQINIEEAMPDPVKFPALHEQERVIQTKEVMAPKTIAGQAFYCGDPGLSDMEGMIKALGSAKSLRASHHKKNDRFHADWLFTWESDKIVRHALLSLDEKEVMFVQGELRLRYDLSPEALAPFKERLSHLRLQRPDALQLAEPLLAPLRDGGAITVYEGPGHGDISDEEFVARGKIEIGGYRLLKTASPTAPRDPQALRQQITGKDLFSLWGGVKACGGFMPDFAISWQVGEETVSLLICYTCREAKFVRSGADGFLLYDLQEEAFKVVRSALEPYGMKEHLKKR